MTTAALMSHDQPTVYEYLRVSFDRFGKEKSQGEQHDDNEERRQEHGWRFGGTYKDSASASRYSRKARNDFDQLIKDLRDPASPFKPGDILQLWESSRSTRRSSEMALMLDLCIDRGMMIDVTDDERVFNPANGKHYRDLMQQAINNEYSSAETSARVKRDAKHNAKLGRPHGRTPYGYVRRYNDQPPFEFIGQDVKPKEAVVVVLIITDVARGESLRAIQRTLWADYGLDWNAKRIRTVAMNYAYLGKRSYKGELFDAVWQPICTGTDVTLEEFTDRFYKAQEVLTDATRVDRKPGGTKHLLSMLARCGRCGGPMTATTRRGVAQYWCHDGGHIYVNQGALDDYVTVRLLAWLADPERWQRLRKEPTDDRQLLTLRADLAALRDRFAGTRRQLVAGAISPETFADLEPAFVAEIASKEAAIAERSTPPVVRALFTDPDASIADQWVHMPLTARRAVIREYATIGVSKDNARSRRAVPLAEMVALTLGGAE